MLVKGLVDEGSVQKAVRLITHTEDCKPLPVGEDGGSDTPVQPTAVDEVKAESTEWDLHDTGKLITLNAVQSDKTITTRDDVQEKSDPKKMDQISLVSIIPQLLAHLEEVTCRKLNLQEDAAFVETRGSSSDSAILDLLKCFQRTVLQECVQFDEDWTVQPGQ